MQEEDDICLEIDFLEKKLRFVCRNMKCRHMNEIDLSNWQEKQKQSPLPRTSFLR